MFFKKKQKTVIKLIEFSGQEVSTGMVGGYILGHLYNHMGFRNIGYSITNSNAGDLRIELYSWFPSSRLINYFKDRCPAIVEQEVQKSIQMPHSFIDMGDIEVVTTYQGGNNNEQN